MRYRKSSLAAVAALACLAALLPASALGAEAPAWKLSATSQPTNLIPGSSGEGGYLLVATNVGAKTATGEITIEDTLPEGLAAASAGATSNDQGAGDFTCTLVPTVVCKGEGPVHSGFTVWAQIDVDVTAPEGSVRVNEAEISGGGGGADKALTSTTISSSVPPFDFLAGEEGFRAPIVEADGSPSVGAGSHPYEAITDLGFPTIKPGEFLTGAGHLQDVSIDFPPGMLANPAATPARCTEAQLTSESHPGCPPASQVGVVTITTFAIAALGPKSTPLYNMVPPPGAPASFGFNALGVGIFPHVIASIRTDSDYGASGHSNDILARGLNPVLDVSAELWGDPAAEAHDFARGKCLFSGATESCPLLPPDPHPSTFLALPVDCPARPLHYEAFADSWEEPFPEFEEREAEYESADLEGGSTELGGCNELDFKPTITAKPTTNVIDSPSGLDVDLHQPQEFGLLGRSTAALRDVKVTLPEGLAVNAAQADGLAVCDSAQIGTITPVGQSPASFSAEASHCPDASKLGTVEVGSPLLAQYDAENKVQRDPQGNAIPEALHGSVYIAKPFDNPFNSLLAIYLTVEDPKTGIFAKLAGKVEPDPLTGRLTTSFEENPELPLQDAKVHLFTGARSPLQTPPTCNTFTTITEMVPWSAPETPNANPSDSFATTAAPGGGPCPATVAQAPNAPAFTAGTLNPQAGTFSPLVAKLSREDGSQRIAKLETVLPTGLSAKLAGVAQCSDAAIAAAQARNRPDEGALELASPSCPAASEIGVVNVGAGAGPTPFHIQGRLYLAGPYKGAPLSFVAITPAVAGPFDLGVVAVRIAAYLDPVSAQVRAVSDPFPQILQGIPVDVRSVAVQAARSQFTLNPTSCEPKSFGGSVTSIAGAVAPLFDTFQVGNCGALPYKPKLNTRLFGPIHRGGHPRFRAVFEQKPGEANTARIVFALPRSEFIDQAHFRTICTRVQFAANQCPAGSVYGHVTATSSLVDYPVEGPIYLRSSNHQLPDVVAVLKGPPSQPIEIDLDGRVDSINGGIRTTFETVPDQRVTKAVVTLQGAKKGLFQNSTNICKGVHRATVKLIAQNGKIANLNPQMKADCPKSSKRKGGGKHK
jgi:uncharacterized repeat protein (TIGR01451 family)